eukprot:CAMPEP_0178653568 /NCGR_PEP_ID=MMETSP0698-20121128/23263_1 /TAXON_ID=265572 /ORGANISM="Extubocellulus spinifer, Strain CCMP396" /LENGTH=93 /DNA_ID=CAMNT_0020295371 /DNA_START=277 /DNA_END=558 /DNA_ORIENTATION=+
MFEQHADPETDAEAVQRTASATALSVAAGAFGRYRSQLAHSVVISVAAGAFAFYIRAAAGALPIGYIRSLDPIGCSWRIGYDRIGCSWRIHSL